jgi:hypothetical protein
MANRILHQIFTGGRLLKTVISRPFLSFGRTFTEKLEQKIDHNSNNNQFKQHQTLVMKLFALPQLRRFLLI